VPLEDIVDVQISAATATPSRVGFGTPLLLAYHAKYVDRVRSYTSLQGMVDDGFLTTDAAYKMALAVLSQNPHPPTFKVGRRAAAPTQVVRLTPTLTTEGLVLRFSILGTDFEYEIPSSASVASICTALTSLILGDLAGAVSVSDDTTHVTVTAVVGADVDAVATAAVFIGTASPVTILGAAFDGLVGDSKIYPPRIVEVVFASDADWDATTLTVTGLDEDGVAQTESIAVPNGGNATVLGTKLWTQVTRLDIPAQSGNCAGTVGLGPAAGALYSYTVDSLGLELHDLTADPGISADIDAVVAADDDWYGLAVDSNSEAEVNAAAANVEARRKVFLWNSADTRVKVAAETTDVGSDTKGASYARSMGLWNNDTLGYAGLAWMAEELPKDPGSSTWPFKRLAGVVVDSLTSSEESALDGKYVSRYERVAGLPVTLGGRSGAGEFLDVVQTVDWLTARIKERVFGLLANNAKLPYTDVSVDLIRGEILAQLHQGVSRGALADDPAPAVSAPKVADVDPLDRAARLLPDVTFTARLAGAIHKVTIVGTLSV
jgi:uncharacterized protein DUF3383